ncbi:MAG: cysteine desulfurase-like protein [Actinomycetales bacterium]
MTYDAAAVRDLRAQIPALADGRVWLDGAAGTQLPTSVIEAIAGVYRRGVGNVHGPFPASETADGIVAEARAAVADLVGGVPQGVMFGPSMTAMTYRVARALADTWQPGDNVVLSQLDHDADVRPWVHAAARAGVEVRWARVDVTSGELPAEQYDELLDDRTRLVAVTAASNVLGTKPDVAAIAERAHRVGALVYVDGVHGTPHGPVDMRAVGADFWATSAYKWCGPHIGCVIADPALLETLHPDKLVPSPDSVPERFELGTLPFADLAGVTAAVEHLAGLDPDAAGLPSRRERLFASMTAVQAYEDDLGARMLDGLRSLSGAAGQPRVTVYGDARDRTPTAYFRVADHSPAEVASHLNDRGINVWHGHSYAWEVTGALGIRDSGGAVRAGLVHYNDESDVERLLSAVAELA